MFTSSEMEFRLRPFCIRVPLGRDALCLGEENLHDARAQTTLRLRPIRQHRRDLVFLWGAAAALVLWCCFCLHFWEIPLIESPLPSFGKRVITNYVCSLRASPDKHLSFDTPHFPLPLSLLG